MRDRSGGFILVSALAALALLASLVTGAALLVRSAAADAALARARLAQDALTHAGLELAAYQLFTLKRPPDAISARRVRLDAGIVTLSVTAESAKIDLNGAAAPLLAGLWRRTGDAGLTPEAFASRVIDWRDEDDRPGPSGAERPDYRAAGRETEPRNAPFETVDELEAVLGVGAERAAALKPFVTVHNPEGKLSILAATRETLRMLPGADPALVDRVLELRRAGSAAAAQQAIARLGPTANLVQPGFGRAFEVTVAIEGPAGRSQKPFVIVAPVDDVAAYHVTDAPDRPAGGN